MVDAPRFELGLPRIEGNGFTDHRAKPYAPDIHKTWRKVEESNPCVLPHHGFRDHLPTIQRHLPCQITW